MVMDDPDFHLCESQTKNLVVLLDFEQFIYP